MKNAIRLLALFLFASAFADMTQQGLRPVVDDEIRNSYGIRRNSVLSRTTSPWYILVDSVFADTTGRGTYKKIGAADTSKAILSKLAYGQAFLGLNRVMRASASDDSGAFTIRVHCYDAGALGWIDPNDYTKSRFPTDSAFYDTSIAVPKDTASWMYEAKVPACDSLRFEIKPAAATSNSDTINIQHIRVKLR